MPSANLFTGGYWVDLWSRHAEHVLAAAVRIAVILAAYVAIRFLMLRLVRRLGQSLLKHADAELAVARQSRIRSLQTALGSIVTFTLGFVAMIMVLQAAGINIVPLITTASVAGLAVGFGAQKLVRDWISGIFILVEDQYGVGDRITIGTVELADVMTGVVEELGMRITRVRSDSGAVCTISNGDIIHVHNHSRGNGPTEASGEPVQ